METKENVIEAGPLDESKEALRREMRLLRRRLEPAWIASASDLIQKTVLSLDEFQRAETVGCYLALPYEVQTRMLREQCYEAGQRVCVPAWNEDHARYEMTWLEPGEDMCTGRWNIREPASSNRAGTMDVDLVIVPALAFGRHGARLGHGGGHYDRMLGSWSGIHIGVAFDFQCFDQVPSGSQDIPVDLVVTEQAVYPSTTAPPG